MQQILYIEAGLDITPLHICDATYYIFTSEKNILDEFTSIMQKEGWDMRLTAIYRDKIFTAEYTKDNRTLVYYFNASFPKDYFTILKLCKFSKILSHSNYHLDFISEYFPGITAGLVCI